MVDEYKVSLTMQRDLELKLEFFRAMNRILKDKNVSNSLSGYLMHDIDLKDLRPGENMKIHAVLFSSQTFRVIELLDDENCIESAEKRLAHVVRAIAKLIKNKITVEGVIVFPRKVRQPTSIMRHDNSVLHQDELAKLFIGFSKTSTVSKQVTEDVKVALATMFQISYYEQCHAKSEQEAICRAAQKLFLQRPETDIKSFTQTHFNSIKLTDIQNCIKDDLLAGNAIVWGGYGTGKSVAVVAAIRDSIERYTKLVKENRTKQEDFKILFLSAQNLLSDKDLTLSPFLLMIEKWVREICEDIGCHNDLQIINYTQFLNLDINFPMQIKARNKREVLLSLYLLKKRDLEILKSKAFLYNFDIIVLEETHAIDSNFITNFVSSLKRASTGNERDSKVWITSNTEKFDLNLPGFSLSPKLHVNPDNLRNTPAVVKLAEAINTNIGPERYPSTALPVSSIKCQMDSTYGFEPNGKKRLRKITEEVRQWKKWLSDAQLLLIDCESSRLYEELKAEGICFKRLEDKYEISEPLLLCSSDPIEAVVAGAEWHVLMIHITAKTLNSIEMIKLFSKRIISRATTKVLIFSDRDLNLTKVETSYLKSDQNNDLTVEFADNIPVGNVETTPVELPDEYNCLNAPACNLFTLGNNSVNHLLTKETDCSDDICNLIKSFEEFRSEMTTASNQKFTDYAGYNFTQIRVLDDSLTNESENIYLVHGQENSFVVQFNCENPSSCQVVQARDVFENLWKVRLPAYCGSNLVSPRKTENVTRITKLLYLLQPKIVSSENNKSGVISVSAEEADQFAKKGKNFLFSLVLNV